MNGLIFRAVERSDAGRIAEIYNPYITGSTITFEEQPITAAEIEKRILASHIVDLPWLCAEKDGNVIGYAYAARWRERSAYRYTAETTIYVQKEFSGAGIGKFLYQRLLDEVRAAGIHVAMAVITLPNPASVALHERLGFTKVAHFVEVGFKFNRWLDVGYWHFFL